MSTTTELLWHNALAAVPLALAVAAICRWCPCRPATRHLLWLLVLVWLLSPRLAPSVRSTDLVCTTDLSKEERIEPRASARAALDRFEPRASAREVFSPSGPAPAPRPDPIRAQVPPPSPPNRNGDVPMPRPDADGIHATDRPEAAGSRRTTPTPPRTVARSAPFGSVRLAPTTDTVGRLFILDLLPAVSKSVKPGAAWLADRLATLRMPLRRADAAERALTDALSSAAFVPDAPAAERVLADATTVPNPDSSHESAGPSGDPAGESPKRSEYAESNVPPAPDAEPAPGRLRGWVAGLLRVRDAVGSLPPVPTVVWLAGVIAVVIAQAARFVVARRRLHRAVPATADVRGEVAVAAGALGLRRVPETYMLDARICPVVLCGRRARLVLPTQLWADLDQTGREAVLYHELAHLRRRDHWVCWVEMLAGALYWWHPVVWWVRRRLREEAEFCCDAWVRWVMPRGRRAYAEALVRTTQYVGPGASPLAVGIGITTVRANRLARRLTMVMTDSSTPGRSMSGLALVGVLAALGWITTPARSCPPDKAKAEAAAPTAAAASARFIATRPPEAPKPPNVDLTAPVPAPRPPRVTWSGRAVADRPDVVYVAPSAGFLAADVAAVDDPDLEARIKRLERELERLNRQLERLTGALERAPSARAVPAVPAQPRPPAAGGGGLGVTGPTVGRLRSVPPTGGGRSGVSEPSARTLMRGGATVGPTLGLRAVDSGEIIVRTYELPEAKCKALCDLLIRDDVPIRVRPLDKAIEVHATAAQHEAFRAFVDLIRHGWEDREYKLPKGKLEAFSKLMVMDDVPILVSPSGDGIGMRATATEHAILKGFLDLLGEQPSPVPAGRRRDTTRETGATGRAAPAAAPAGARGRSTAPIAADAARRAERAATDARRRASETARQVAREHEEMIKQLKKKLEQMNRHVRELSQKASQLEVEAEKLEARSESYAEDAESTADRKKAAELKAKARETQSEARRMRRDAKSVRKDAERAETEMEAARELLDKLRDDQRRGDAAPEAESPEAVGLRLPEAVRDLGRDAVATVAEVFGGASTPLAGAVEAVPPIADAPAAGPAPVAAEPPSGENPRRDR